MLVLGRLSTDVVRDLLACICFGRSLHCAVLLLTSFDCLSFMNMCSGLSHSADCPLSSLSGICSLHGSDLKKMPCFRILYKASIFVGQSCLNRLRTTGRNITNEIM